MKSLYCEECGEYLMAGSGSLVDCHCGWKQPTDEGIDAADYEALQAECEKLRKDAERLDWIVSEGAIVAHAGVRGEPHRYRVEWPLLGEVGTSWFTSERDAIDAAIQEDNP